MPWENIKSFVVCSTIKICFNSQFFFSCSCEVLTSLGVRRHLHLLTFPISNFFSQTIGPMDLSKKLFERSSIFIWFASHLKIQHGCQAIPVYAFSLADISKISETTCVIALLHGRNFHYTKCITLLKVCVLQYVFTLIGPFEKHLKKNKGLECSFDGSFPNVCIFGIYLKFKMAHSFFLVSAWNSRWPTVFSSPDPKGHVRYCHHLASVVRPLTFHIFTSRSWRGVLYTTFTFDFQWYCSYKSILTKHIDNSIYIYIYKNL